MLILNKPVFTLTKICVCLWIICRSSAGMWRVSLHAHGHDWFSWSKPGWAVRAQAGLPVGHRDASQQSNQLDLHLLWAGDFFYMSLRLCQSSYWSTVFSVLHIYDGVFKKMTSIEEILDSPLSFCWWCCKCVCVSGVWWGQHSLPSGWNLLWNIHSFLFCIEWKLSDCSLHHWWFSAETRLQCYLHVCAK